jgi:hypothetical protein
MTRPKRKLCLLKTKKNGARIMTQKKDMFSGIEKIKDIF